MLKNIIETMNKSQPVKLDSLPTATVSLRKPGKITIGIVEDDTRARKMFVNWINSAPEFQVVCDFGSAESALAGLAAFAPEIVLMDINLPKMNGVECVRRLKPLLPNTQLVILTVYEDDDHIYNALQAGATGYLLKESSRPQLIAALQEVHRGGSPMASNIARKVCQLFQQKTPKDTSATDELSTREREVLVLLARGFLYKEIADELKIAVPTVNSYIRRIYEKMHVRSRSQAVAKYSGSTPPM